MNGVCSKFRDCNRFQISVQILYPKVLNGIWNVAIRRYNLEKNCRAYKKFQIRHGLTVNWNTVEILKLLTYTAQFVIQIKLKIYI